MSSRRIIAFGIIVAIIILFLCNLLYGSVKIPAQAVIDILFGRETESVAWMHIVLQLRLPKAVTALLAGASLSVSGLMLQTLFRNQLAGPSILGISDGANLGVAIIMLYIGGSVDVGISIISAAFIGAMAVLIAILYFSSKVQDNILVLIIGMMMSYLASSGISILNVLASSESIRSYVLWGLGSFSNVSYLQLPFFSLALLTGLIFSVLLIKPLNVLLLGENYAFNLGIPVNRIRICILVVTGFLTAVVTAFCGPVGFIGLAVPHMARMALQTSNQQILLPVTLLFGAVTALICNLLTIIPFGNGLLPLNAITPLFGAPIIVYVLIIRKKL